MENNKHKDRLSAWLFDVWTTFGFRLLGVNLLFLLACVPVVTIPAALCGLYGVVQQYYRGIHGVTVVKQFVKEFLESFSKRTLLAGMLILVPVLICALLYSLLPFAFWLVLSAFLILIVVIGLNWFVSQLTFLTLKPIHALTNALKFVCICSRENFLLIVLHALELTVLAYGAPLSAVLLLFLPVLHAQLATWIIMPALKRYLVTDGTIE